MAILHIEKLGGLANFGGVHSRLRSQGQFDTVALAAKDLLIIEALFHKRSKSAPEGADGFRFRISRTTAKGTETVEVHESHVPVALASCVKDEIV